MQLTGVKPHVSKLSPHPCVSTVNDNVLHGLESDQPVICHIAVSVGNNSQKHLERLQMSRDCIPPREGKKKKDRFTFSTNSPHSECCLILSEDTEEIQQMLLVVQNKDVGNK